MQIHIRIWRKVALNRTCTEDVAEAISKVFVEIILAPEYAKNL
ncbi:MAG: hypothetical protein Ct9H300mP18_05940 [Candidatus Neomarinimicrobiota bacterium]|nr:MAG: hypothetical protein Ct9H300mP18_05940 [Candidatus Neomarinimicrobiota bacterium]